MKNFIKSGLCALAIGLTISSSSFAAYESRFEVINFDPAVDGSDYVTVYGAKNLEAWQGNMGFYFDYSNRPLQVFVTGSTNGRQSIIDHLTVVDLYGALGFTDWFEAGLNIPVVVYNWFFREVDVSEDHGGGMGDIQFMAKFRLVDIEKHRLGLALIPQLTLPSGDVTRYTGNGNVTGSLTAAVEYKPSDRLSFALNLGGVLRDDVHRSITVPPGVTGTIHVDDQFTYGLAGNYRFTKNWEGIVEAHGSTVFADFFATQDTSPFEVGGAIRYKFNNSGFGTTLGGTGGIMDGIGNPRFRIYAGLNWTSPAVHEEVVPPVPTTKIVENKIILMGKIFYDTDKATIKAESFPILDGVVDILNQNPQVTLVEVQGHCDERGSDEYNMKLSDARANSAVNYLVNKGINPSRLVAKGYGESQPIAPNTTAEGMSQNRRTEFVILEQNGQSVPASSQYIPSEPTNLAPAPVPTAVPVDAPSDVPSTTSSLDSEKENTVTNIPQNEPAQTVPSTPNTADVPVNGAENAPVQNLDNNQPAPIPSDGSNLVPSTTTPVSGSQEAL